VVIASGHTVTYDVVEGSPNDVELGISATSLDIDIRGTLQFDTSATQPLRLRFKGYIGLRANSQYLIGTEQNPMPVRVTVMKTTAGYHMHRVLGNNATISIVGSPNIPYDAQAGWYRFVTTLTSPAASGATQITVADNLNWQVGDFILMPQLPNADPPTAFYYPFQAQVTAVSGNTLTLSGGLPHAYPAGAPVAKATRPIVLWMANNTPNNYFFLIDGGVTVNVRGLKWFVTVSSGSNSYNFIAGWNGKAMWQGSVIEYSSFLNDSPRAGFVFFEPSNQPIVKYHCGTVGVGTETQPIIYDGGVLTQYAGSPIAPHQPPIIRNASVWNFRGEHSAKVFLQNCGIFNLMPASAIAYYLDDCTIYGFNPLRAYDWRPQSIYGASYVFCRRCRFFNYSALGFSVTYRNWFDWGGQNAAGIERYFVDCEFNGTWVEPSTFTAPMGHSTPKVCFFNKKVGSTVIKEQEFQAGGIIQSEENEVPPPSLLPNPATFKLTPKNQNLAVVKDFFIAPCQKLLVAVKRTNNLTNASIRLVSLNEQFVSNPETSGSDAIDLSSMAADTWHLLVLENESDEIKIVRVLAKGTTGSLYVAMQNQVLLFNEFYLIAY
jgi:hypothetical protein